MKWRQQRGDGGGCGGSMRVAAASRRIILCLCVIFYSTQLNHFFLPFFVQIKVAIMICCLNTMALSLKILDLYFQLLPVQQISKVIVFTAAPCHTWHPGPDATLLII
jgi:hypothetical protein